jgi:hypothetical protein
MIPAQFFLLVTNWLSIAGGMEKQPALLSGTNNSQKILVLFNINGFSQHARDLSQ